jgi:hypothetical protein
MVKFAPVKPRPSANASMETRRASAEGCKMCRERTCGLFVQALWAPSVNDRS